MTTGAAGAVAEFGMPSGENYWKLPAGGGPIDVALQADLSSQRTGVYNLELSVGLTRYSRHQRRHRRLQQRVDAGRERQHQRQCVRQRLEPGGLAAGRGELGSIFVTRRWRRTTCCLSPPLRLVAPTSTPPAISRRWSSLPTARFAHADGSDGLSFQRTGPARSTRDRNGNQTQYLYDVAGRLTTIVDPVGLRTTFSYTGNLVTGITADRHGTEV